MSKDAFIMIWTIYNSPYVYNKFIDDLLYLIIITENNNNSNLGCLKNDIFQKECINDNIDHNSLFYSWKETFINFYF
jgi:hypothetical protein